ncbi:MAG: carboxypeptidase regulatory-like domain-containing protein [Bryobacterales bacterium]|nr:carboxypeptidase regulatory-like domain-containing protein [Bryobacterales bacterium]
MPTLLVSLSLVNSQELTTGTIVGVVLDQTGAVVPAATVVVTNAATGAERRTTASPTGDFLLPGLAPATYNLRVESPGFRAYVVEGLELRVNQVLRLTVRLEVGQVTEAVTVTGEVRLLETDTAALGQVIDYRRITDLPLNGRNLVTLALISAGISPKPFYRGTQFGVRDQFVTIEGGRESSTNYLMDGVMARSLRFNNLSIRVNIDAVQEFKVNRNSFSSEFGQGQSVITAVTRSGTNEFHGSVYEFLRNDNLDARRFFDARRPEFRSNQFGAAVGGPLARNRAFFFAAYEGLRLAQGRTFLGVVPEPRLLEGDFSASATQPVDFTTGAPFPGGRIPPTRFSRFATTYRKWIPAPNSAPPNNWRRVADFRDAYDSLTLRFDQNLSSRHQLFQRYMWYDSEQVSPGVFFDINYPQKGQNLTVQSTYALRPTLVNEGKIGYNRALHYILPINPGGNPVQELGLRNLAGATDPINFGVPFVSIAGFTGLGNGTITQGSVENIYTLADNLSWVRGSHTVKFGAEVQHRRYHQLTEVPPRGSFSFNGQYTRVGLADFLLGVPNSATGALGSSRSQYRSNYLATFVQYDWRASQKLTWNFGLRYEYAAPWKEQRDLEGFFNPVTGLITYHKVPATIPPALRGLYDPQGGRVKKGIIDPDKNNFAPRIGLAWRPFGENTVIRAGFGVYYDNVNLNELQFTRLVAPFYGIFTLVGDARTPNVFVDRLFPSLDEIERFPAPFSVMPNNRTPYSIQYNFNIQRQLPRGWLLELAYSGSNFHKLWKRFNQNQAYFDPTGTIPIRNRLPFPQFDPGILTSANDANGHWNGASIRVERSYTSGFHFLANYTFGKVIDNNSGEIEANDTRDARNKRLERGRGRHDQRHRFVSSFSYELPFGRNKRWLTGVRGLPSVLVSGWRAQGIVLLLSGMPFHPTAPSVHNTGSFIPQYPNRVGNGKLDRRGPNAWFDVSAFRIPPVGTQGNSGRNILDGPETQQFDFSLIKEHALGERLRLQFRAEFFNLPNHPNFGLPVTDISSRAAATITSVADGRDIQFGLRLSW